MASSLLALTVLSVAARAAASPTYVLGGQGESCASACGAAGRECLNTGVGSASAAELIAAFKSVGVDCKPGDISGRPWWAPDQPAVVTAPWDSLAGHCLGVSGIPAYQGSFCQANHPATTRLCACGEDVRGRMTFGTGYSDGHLTGNETTLFNHVLDPSANALGLMNHFWSTQNDPACVSGLVVRYYVDGETTASIAYTPPMAAGVGFDAPLAPWGTKWAGIGAGKVADGGGQAWFNNYQIPFQKSIRVTVQHREQKTFKGFFFIVRGRLQPLVNPNHAFSIGGVPIPAHAKLKLQTFEGGLKPLQTLDVVSVPKGHSGFVFTSALAVANGGTGGLNFLEGCYHMYDPPETPFPGVVLATGTEDFFDSGWYFNAGEFHMPVSGFTHLVKNATRTEWSGYRFHEMDPLYFKDGVRFTWRCGDVYSNITGLKCYTDDASGGGAMGSPTCDSVVSYGWVYVWEN